MCYVNIKERGEEAEIKALGYRKGYAEQGVLLGRMVIHQPESFGRESSLCLSPNAV